MFAGIDVASERHVLARLDPQGVPIGTPEPITEDREGRDALLRLLRSRRAPRRGAALRSRRSAPRCCADG